MCCLVASQVVRLETEMTALQQSVAEAERAKLTVKAHADSEVSRMNEQVAQLTSTVKSAEQKIKRCASLLICSLFCSCDCTHQVHSTLK